MNSATGTGTAHPDVPPPPGPPRIRWSWVVLGIVIAAFGLMFTIGGALTSLATDTLASIDPDGEARTPGSIDFEAERGEYIVSVVGSRRTGDSSLASATSCQIQLANEERLTIDGAVQGVATTSGNIASVGSFDAVPGRTTITCDVGGRDDMRYIVDKESALESVAIWIVLVGVLMLSIGATLLLAGIFRKRPAATDTRLLGAPRA